MQQQQTPINNYSLLSTFTPVSQISSSNSSRQSTSPLLQSSTQFNISEYDNSPLSSSRSEYRRSPRRLLFINRHQIPHIFILIISITSVFITVCISLIYLTHIWHDGHNHNNQQQYDMQQKTLVLVVSEGKSGSTAVSELFNQVSPHLILIYLINYYLINYLIVEWIE